MFTSDWATGFLCLSGHGLRVTFWWPGIMYDDYSSALYLSCQKLRQKMSNVVIQRKLHNASSSSSSLRWTHEVPSLRFIACWTVLYKCEHSSTERPSEIRAILWKFSIVIRYIVWRCSAHSSIIIVNGVEEERRFENLSIRSSALTSISTLFQFLSASVLDLDLSLRTVQSNVYLFQGSLDSNKAELPVHENQRKYHQMTDSTAAAAALDEDDSSFLWARRWPLEKSCDSDWRRRRDQCAQPYCSDSSTAAASAAQTRVIILHSLHTHPYSCSGAPKPEVQSRWYWASDVCCAYAWRRLARRNVRDRNFCSLYVANICSAAWCLRREWRR